MNQIMWLAEGGVIQCYQQDKANGDKKLIKECNSVATLRRLIRQMHQQSFQDACLQFNGSSYEVCSVNIPSSLAWLDKRRLLKHYLSGKIDSEKGWSWVAIFSEQRRGGIERSWYAFVPMMLWLQLYRSRKKCGLGHHDFILRKEGWIENRLGTN